MPSSPSSLSSRESISRRRENE
ncbi:hypothetical protein NC652_016229 [Populus alba x Populus x berolinensis]|nr:hypothetical protein NC652_016229 [Populus alba x Populus x berolinensis]